jgi:16S rRNA (guanine(966)-N(2))-methyltransferase RsmD
MRITGGNLKGIRPGTGFAAHVRPTTDFVREALFNKLQHGVGLENATVLDLFSGSGIMALEFLSRGGESVTSVDRDVKNILFQKGVKAKYNLNHWNIIKSDVARFLAVDNQLYDVVFADPPYDMQGVNQLPAMVLPRLNSEGIFLLEHKPGIEFAIPPNEVRNYGSTTCSIFVK